MGWRVSNNGAMPQESTTFRAAFPPIQSAIKVYGDRQGMRLQLDIPETEMSAAMALFLWRECLLEVTISPIEDCFTGHNNAVAKRTKRKSQWAASEEPLAVGDLGGRGE